MNSFFSNIHIRRGALVTPQAVIKSLENMMASWGYERVQTLQEAEAVLLAVDSESSEWVSVYCDELFEFEEDEFREIAEGMSSELNTDLLNIGCFDDDYLYMHLINASEQIDAWASCGGEYGEEYNDLSVWEDKVQNFPLFRQSFEEGYVFAEEVLAEMEECLRLPRAFSTAGSGDFDADGSDKDILRLYFRPKKDNKPTEKPHLKMKSEPLLPSFLERRDCVSVVNEGGESKGISVFFAGAYVEQDEITFSDTAFAYAQGGIISDEKPFELEKVQLADGRWVYYHHDGDLTIPEKGNARLKEEWCGYPNRGRSICVLFTPHGNKRKLLDITVALVPDENPNGQVCWNIWHRFGSKEEYIRMYNEQFSGDILAPLLREDFD